MNKILFMVSLLLTLGFIAFVIDSVVVNYKYEKMIGSYIENAYEVNTPDEMISQVNLAIGGMRNANLNDNDYGAFIFKKPDNSMKWQYKFLENFIERAEAVKAWQDKVNNDEKAVESLGDVYEQKMDNLREFLKENGRADWIAKNAWYVKYHLILYFNILIGIIWLAFIILLWGIAFADEQ